MCVLQAELNVCNVKFIKVDLIILKCTYCCFCFYYYYYYYYYYYHHHHHQQQQQQQQQQQLPPLLLFEMNLSKGKKRSLGIVLIESQTLQSEM